MTRERAIEILKDENEKQGHFKGFSMYSEALEMAISALSAPSTNVISIDQANAMIKSYVSHYEENKRDFDGMTNREIISEFVERDDSFAIMVDEVNGTVSIELSLDFWNAPLQDKPPCGRCRYHDDYADKSIRPTYCKTMCANNWNGFRERER